MTRGAPASRGPGLGDLARGVAAEFVALRPSPVRWPVATGAALSIGIPLGAFSLAGREDLGLMASTGALLALHLSARSRRERARALPLIGGGLVAASGLGALSAFSAPLSAFTVFAVTTVAALVLFGFGAGPPGAMFFVLSCGVGIHLATPVADGGVGQAPWRIASMTAVGCSVAYAIVLLPLLAPSVRRRDAEHHEERVPWTFGLHPSDSVVVARVVLGTVLGILAAWPLGIPHSYWVLLTVVAILQGGAGRRLTAVRGVQRVVGTVVGLGVFWVVLLLEPHNAWLALVVALLQFGAEMVVVRNYGLALTLITPLALIISAQGSTSRETLVLERLGDTLLGAVCAGFVLTVGWLAAGLPQPGREDRTPHDEDADPGPDDPALT